MTDHTPPPARETLEELLERVTFENSDPRIQRLKAIWAEAKAEAPKKAEQPKTLDQAKAAAPPPPTFVAPAGSGDAAAPPPPVSAAQPKTPILYIFVDQEVKGPFTRSQIEALLQMQTVNYTTPCCEEGANDWKTVADVVVAEFRPPPQPGGP